MTAKAEMATQASRSSALVRWLRANALPLGITAVAILIWIFFAIGSPQTFFSKNIYAAFMSTTPFFAIVALPLTMVVVTGEIDLSFPSVMSLGMLVFVTVLMSTANAWLALAACLGAGLSVGLLNGWIIVHFGVPSLVVTIGTQFLWRGVVLVLTGGSGASLTPVRETAFYDLFVGRINGYWPMQMVWSVLIALFVWVVLNRFRIGAHVYLVGDNADSARLMGVSIYRTKMFVFGMTGLAAALAGLIASLEVSYYWPTLGEGYLLNTLSSVFLGGTSVFGGAGTVVGTFVASFIVGAINAGIVAVGLSGFWTQLIYGLIIVLSVVLQTVLGKRLG